MSNDYRKTIADGDLLLEHKVHPLPFVPFFGQWVPWRNESEEVRLLKQHMDKAFAAYKDMQRQYVIAATNVKADMELLRLYSLDNTKVDLTVPFEQSILEEREGLKYNFGNNNGKSSANKQQQQNKGNGNNSNQQQQKRKGGTKQTVGLLDFFLKMAADAKITVPKEAVTD